MSHKTQLIAQITELLPQLTAEELEQIRQWITNRNQQASPHQTHQAQQPQQTGIGDMSADDFVAFLRQVEG